MSEQLLLVMLNKAPNRLDRNSASAEPFEVDYVMNESMCKEYETDQARQLFNTALAVAVYCPSDGCFDKVFVEHFCKHQKTMKYITGDKYIHTCRFEDNRKPKMGHGQNLPYAGEVRYFLHTISDLDASISTGRNTPRKSSTTGNSLGYGVHTFLRRTAHS